MIDKKDKQTIEVFPKRGRPSTGKALTPAQRKKLQRERAKEIVWGTRDNDFTKLPTAMIIDSLSFAVSQGAHHITNSLCRELIKRAKANAPDKQKT